VKIKDKQFLKSISTLTSGSIIAQAIALGCAPILTRLFKPEEMGLYTYLLSFTFLFMPVVNGRYDMAIVTEKNDQKVYPLIKLSLIIGIIVSVFITSVFGIYNLLFSDNPKSITSLCYILLILLSFALLNVLTAFNNRVKEYNVISTLYIIRTGTQNIGAILLQLLFKIGSNGLTISYILGQYLGVRFQSKTLKSHLPEIINATKAEMKEVLALYKNQPFYSAPASLANSFSYSSITLFIEAIYGLTAVGFYSISVRLLGIPLSLISGNVSKVFFESATKEFNQTGKFINSFKKTFLFQLLLAVPMVLIIILFAPDLCRIFFGKKWIISGQYALLLAPMFGIRFIVTTLTPAMIIVNKQSKELLLQLLFAFSSILCFVLAKYLMYSIKTYLIVICCLFSIVYLIYLFVIYRYSLGTKEPVN
jgi:O-antigen/teichoic acid export membrane protein